MVKNHALHDDYNHIHKPKIVAIHGNTNCALTVETTTCTFTHNNYDNHLIFKGFT